MPAILRYRWFWCYLAVIAAAATVYYVRGPIFHKIRFFVDHDDIHVYFDSSAWVLGRGALYRTIRSEYPPFANLVFAAVRLVSWPMGLLRSELNAFTDLWVALGAVLLGLWVRMARKEDRDPLLRWILLAPATIYFSLYRYDLYPALAFWGSLLALRRDRLVLAALLFGLCIAIKGYALVCLPALFFYFVANGGLKRGILLSAMALLPFALGELCIWLWAGREAVAQPFAFHAARSLNGESTYDAVLDIAHAVGVRTDAFYVGIWPGIYRAGTAVFSMVGAVVSVWMRPARLERLASAMLVALLFSLSASYFYSPQWLIWLVPCLFWIKDRRLLLLGAIYAWVTYLYFPVGFDVQHAIPLYFEIVIVAMAAIRILLLARAI